MVIFVRFGCVKFYGLLTEYDCGFIRKGFRLQGNPGECFLFPKGVVPTSTAAALGAVDWT